MKALFWILKESFLASRLLMVVSTVLGLAVAVVPAAQVMVMGSIADRLDDRASMAPILGPLAILALCVAVGPSLTSIVEALRSRSSQHLQARLNIHLVRQISTLSPSDLVDAKVSSSSERYSRAISEQLAFVPLRLTRAIEASVGSTAVVLALFSISQRAAIFALAAIFPPMLLSRFMARVWDRQWRDVAVPYDREKYLRELLLRPRTAFELSTYGGSGRIGREVGLRWQEIIAIMGRALRPQIVGLALVAVCSTVLFFFAILMVVSDTSSVGRTMAGVYGIIAATIGTAGAGVYFGLVMESVPSAHSFRAFLQEVFRGQLFVPGLTAQLVTASNVSFTYPGDEKPGLRDIDIEVRFGEMVAVVGVNGAGKSTLVNCILGVREVDYGSIAIDGSACDVSHSGQWFSHFGYVPQDFGRFELTVRESLLVGVGMHEVDDDELWGALRAARLSQVVESFPKGLDQMLGEQWGGSGLSGGQWQRMALARVYLRNAPICVLDEPTSSVDAETEMEIFRELWRTRTSRITIVISHRAWTLRYTDRIYVMDHGNMTEEGTFDELLDRRGLFHKIFSEQANSV